MNKIKKAIWFSFGIIFLCISYVGILVPGIPWSTPAIIATWCFAKSSTRFHNYMMNHKVFGPFIKNWNENKVFPAKAKLAMFIGMDVSIIILWLTTQNWKAVAGMAIFFSLIMLWTFKWPSTKEEAEERKATGKSLGWFGRI